MAKKYESTFISDIGKEYTVEIHQASFTGAATEFTTIDLQIKYDDGGDEENRFSPIMSSEATVNMLIDSEALNTFVEDLVGSYDDEYFLYIRLPSTTPGQLDTFKWAGYILVDLVVIEDISYTTGYTFVLKAKDGLNTLKNLDYNDDGVPYNGKDTVFSHLTKVLYKLGSVLYAYTSLVDPLLSVVINWHSEEYTYNSTNTVLTKARIPHRAFYYRDTKGNYIYKNCYEVLEEICKAFGARIINSGTGFFVTQINEYLNADSVYEYQFVILGSLSGGNSDYSILLDQNGIEDSSTDIYREGGSSFEFYAPLQYARVEYEHIATRNLLPGAIWNYNDETAKTTEDIASNNFESILQLDLTVAFKTTFTQTVGVKDFTDHSIIFRIEIKLVGAFTTHYYVNTFVRQLNKYQEQGLENQRWETDPGYYYFYTPMIKTDEEELIKNIQLIIGQVPTDGDLSVKVEFYNIYPSSGLDPLPSTLQGGAVPVLEDYYTLTYEASNTFLQYIHTGFFSDQNDIIRFQSDNDNTAYQTWEVTNLIGDGPNLNSPGHLEVKNDSDEWVITENGWKVGNSGDAKNISQLLVNEVIKGQLKPVRKFMQTTMVMVDPNNAFLQPHYAIDYNSGYWVFKGGVYDLKNDSVNGIWFNIKED